MIKIQGVTMNTSDNYTVRRVVAVILMIFTFIFLFWPAFVKLTGIQEKNRGAGLFVAGHIP